VVLPVADRHNDRAREIAEELRAAGFRAQTDDRTESVSRKIRDAELAKAPYMLVVGDREAEAGMASVRHHDEGDLGAMAVGALSARLEAEARDG
jgi:threonyl-tRNA synthetase